MPAENPVFPKSFLWGAATAAYQIEGGNDKSALWDWERRKRWEHRSGRANNSWELFAEDLKLIKSLNLNAYRFSVEWSRVQPSADEWDEAPLLRYASWAKALKRAGVRPFVTLHHFSEPAWLLEKHPKGWLDPAVPKAFLNFVGRAAQYLGPEVNDWMTLNEPMVFLSAAYGAGLFPPGKRYFVLGHGKFDRAVTAMARAHVEARRLLKHPGLRIGLAHQICALEPARPGDEEACDRWDWFMHRRFLDELKGEYDFLGVNYYTRAYVTRLPVSIFPVRALPGNAEVERVLGPAFRWLGGRSGDGPRTEMGWEVVPDGLRAVVEKYSRLYGKPIYITENGIAPKGPLTRQAYLRGHLKALSEAMAGGAKVEGYFYWSLLDNYEWGSYRPRFGLFTRDRKPSEGADYYARVAATGRIT